MCHELSGTFATFHFVSIAIVTGRLPRLLWKLIWKTRDLPPPECREVGTTCWVQISFGFVRPAADMCHARGPPLTYATHVAHRWHVPCTRPTANMCHARGPPLTCATYEAHRWHVPFMSPTADMCRVWPHRWHVPLSGRNFAARSSNPAI